MGEKLERIEAGELPFYYRILLKMPCPNLDRLPDVSKGIFWAIVVPIFIVTETFLVLYLLVALPFPVNYPAAAIAPSILFLFVARVTVERYWEAWNAAVAEQGLKWNIDKSLKEYYRILERKKSRTTTE